MLLIPAVAPLVVALFDPACDFDAALSADRGSALLAVLDDSLLVVADDSPVFDDRWSFWCAGRVDVFFVSSISGDSLIARCFDDGRVVVLPA